MQKCCARDKCSKTQRLAIAHGMMVFVVTAFSVWNVLGSVITNSYCRVGDDIACPVVFAFYREVGAAPIHLVICAISKGFVRVSNCRDFGLLFGAGLALFGIQLLSILGVAWTNADIVSFYQPANPIMVVLLALVLGLERYQCTLASVLKVFGVLTVLGGIALIVFDGEQHCMDAVNRTVCDPLRSNKTMCNGTIQVWLAGVRTDVNATVECCRSCESSTQSTNFIIGNIFVAGGVLCCSLFTVFQKLLTSPTVQRCPSGCCKAKVGLRSDSGSQLGHTHCRERTAFRAVTIITYAYVIAATCMAGFTAAIRPPAHLFAIGPLEIGGVLYSVIVCSVIAYLLLCYALVDISASVSSLYGATQPPITAVIAWCWQKQSIGPLMIAGGLMGIVGLVLTSVCSDEARGAAPKFSETAGNHPLVDPLLSRDDQASQK